MTHWSYAAVPGKQDVCVNSERFYILPLLLMLNNEDESFALVWSVEKCDTHMTYILVKKQFFYTRSRDLPIKTQ